MTEDPPTVDLMAALRDEINRRKATQTPLQMVKAFHEAFGVPTYDTPKVPEIDRRVLRVALMEEEWGELTEALSRGTYGNLIDIADALADLVYVIYGTALEYGIPLDAVLEEVHRSNMAKLGPDGKPILRADGKILKPEGWQPPNIEAILGGK